MSTAFLELFRDPSFQAYHRSKHNGRVCAVCMCINSEKWCPLSQTRLPKAKLEPTRPTRIGTKISALIIGIDDYITIDKLNGAVADAREMKRYLESVLCVPRERIHMLLNGEASRDAIIQAFRMLREDPSIDSDNPIIIYYAGHGGELPPPPEWKSTNEPQTKIQYLLPANYDPPQVYGIPDRTIGALIEQIAKKKGDNITVIFDCCHSGSATRTPDKEFKPRGVKLAYNVPPTLDSSIWKTRGVEVATEFIKHRLRSHVLLSACNQEESAYEVQGRGQFTRALLAMLNEVGLDRLTYANVPGFIGPLRGQNPQCEGYHRDRFFFNVKAADSRGLSYSIHQSGDKYTVDAGSAHGISKGAEFTVYSNPQNTKPALAVMVVDDAVNIGAFKTTVTSRNGMAVDLPEASYALLTRNGEEQKLALYVPQETKFFPVFEAVFRLLYDMAAATFKISVVHSDLCRAKLGVAMTNNQIEFNILDQRVTQFGLTRIPLTVPPDIDKLIHVLTAVTRYYVHLDHTWGNNHIDAKVTVDFYLLTESQSEFDDDGYPALCPVEPSLCQGNRIEFEVDPESTFGIKVTNNTPWDLYPNIFFFDNSDFSIDAYYTQSTAGHPYPPLKKSGGTLTIGYGSGGMAPYRYFLRDGQKIDVGFLKIFLTTQPVDMTNVMQPSPFSFDNVRTQRKVIRPPADTWGTVLIPVVQRRRMS